MGHRRKSASRQWAGEPDWVRAKRALLAAFEPTTERGINVDVAFVKPLGGGLTRRALGTSVELSPDPQGLSGAYVALIPGGKDRNYAQNVRRELEILRWLSLQHVDIRTPRAVALIDDHGAPILVESFVEGIVVDLRAGRQPICPWEFVADIAAKIHAVPPPPNLPMQTRQQVRLELIEAIERMRVLGEGPRPELVDDALAWMRDHLGPPLPCVLVHGDLLGQNLRLYPDQAPGVIDWLYADVGDPAADLAIVTRGVRRPFQIAGGRQRLLDSYNERAATEVSAESLRFFELELLTRWVVDGHTEDYFDDAWLHQIEHLLGRRT